MNAIDTILNTIKQYMKTERRTQRDIAKLFGLSPTAISKIFKKETALKVGVLEKIIIYLNIPQDKGDYLKDLLWKNLATITRKGIADNYADKLVDDHYTNQEHYGADVADFYHERNTLIEELEKLKEDKPLKEIWGSQKYTLRQAVLLRLKPKVKPTEKTVRKYFINENEKRIKEIDDTINRLTEQAKNYKPPEIKPSDPTPFDTEEAIRRNKKLTDAQRKHLILELKKFEVDNEFGGDDKIPLQLGERRGWESIKKRES